MLPLSEWKQYYSFRPLTCFRDLQFFLERGICVQEETYFNLTISPVSEDHVGVVGFYEQITETTSRKLAERRMSTILELGEQTSRARDLQSFWASVASSLSSNPCKLLNKVGSAAMDSEANF